MSVLIWNQWQDLWKLYHKVTFDGRNRLILINEGETEINVQEDLYSAWKQWVLLENNARWVQAMRSVGGDPLPGQRTLGDTYFLMNGWKIRTWEGDHRLTIEGNLYCEDGSSPYIPTLGSWNIFVISTVSNLVESSIKQLPEIEYASFNGAVSIDVLYGKPGTEYPFGTPSNPSNNLADAITIARTRGFRTLRILEPMTLSNSSIVNFTLIGRSNILTDIYLEDSLRCAGVTIENCYINGVLDGGTRLINCQIGDIAYINGNIENCSLNGSIILEGSEDALFSNCRTGNFSTNGAIINLGGFGQNVMLTDWSGAVTFTNGTGSNNVTVQIDGGQITLDPSINGSNIIDLSGIGTLIDNAWSYGSLSTRGLINQGTIANAVNEEIGAEIQFNSFKGGVTIDVVNGTDGIMYPIGTELLPCKTIANALAISQYRGLSALYVIGDLTLSADDVPYYQNGTVVGKGIQASTITIDDIVFDKCTFKECTLQGTFGNGSNIEAYNCKIQDLYNITITANECSLAGIIELNNTISSQFNNCRDAVPGYGTAQILVNDCESLGLWNFSGGIQLSNIITPSTEISVNFSSGRLIVDETDTEGYIIVRGSGALEGTTGGTTIDQQGLMNKAMVATAVWDEDISSHLQSGTTGLSVGIDQFNQAIWIAQTTGTSGTAFPIGTERVPVNNLDDAIAIADARGIHQFVITEDIIIGSTENISGRRFSSQEHNTVTLEDGCVTYYTSFSDVAIEGYTNGYTILENCAITENGLYNFYGMMDRSILNGNIIISDDNTKNAIMVDIYTGNVSGPPTIDCNGDGAKISIRGITGALLFANKTGSTQKIFIDSYSARFGFASTITAGNITIRGIGYIYLDQSTNTTFDLEGFISQNTIAKTVWDQPTTDISLANSIGVLLKAIATNALTEEDIAAIQANLAIINSGVKKASKIIPHNTDLT